MGGIGKTTLAKFIYNELSERFDHCCFLGDVRESSKKGLVELQNYLISTVLKHRDIRVTSVDQGSKVISDTFCNKMVLIVLDDVGQREQRDALARNHVWFDLGSRIIITTRNKDVLEVPQVNGTYEAKEMNSDQALEFFCKHAFRNDNPPDDYRECSTNIASTTAGLPLALEIIGSFLCGKRKAVWDDTWEKLKDSPNEKVQVNLRISYNALDNAQKQIFLDIACLCIAVDKRIAVHMWKDCGFYPENSIEVLTLKSLVKIGENNELRMHDQLRDLGVRQENLRAPEKRRRLWSHQEALDILKAQQGTEMIEALCLDFKGGYGKPYYLTNEKFAKLPNLRFLQMDGANIKGDFKGLLFRLRWLRWHRIPENCTPVNLYLSNLIILDLSNGNFRHDWVGWNQLKVAKKLKVLNLSNCVITRTPDFTAYVNLEELILEGCQSLVKVHPSIWNLKILRRLNLSRTGITELPIRSIGMLVKLEELHALDYLNLKGEVPSDIGNLNCLRMLGLASAKICSLPTSMHLLSELETLNLYDCTELQSLPELPRSLLHLEATCKSMRTCSHLSKLVELEALLLSHCYELLEIPKEIFGVSRPNNLRFEYCKKLQFVQGLPLSLVT